MKNQEIKFVNKDYKYSILIGENILRILPKKINFLCQRTKNIAIILDDTVHGKFKKNYKFTKLQNFIFIFLC